MADTKDISKVFEPGNKVHYYSRHLRAEERGKYNAENGIVKSVAEHGVFVVYKCGGDWDNYENYTGALTDADDLAHGWK